MDGMLCKQNIEISWFSWIVVQIGSKNYEISWFSWTVVQIGTLFIKISWKCHKENVPYFNKDLEGAQIEENGPGSP